MDSAGQFVGAVIAGLPDQGRAVSSKHPHTGQAGCASSTHRPSPGGVWENVLEADSLPRCFSAERVRSFSKTNGSYRQGAPFLRVEFPRGSLRQRLGGLLGPWWAGGLCHGPAGAAWPGSRVPSTHALCGQPSSIQADLHAPPSLPASHSPAQDRPRPSDRPRRCLRPRWWELRSSGLSQASLRT